jgi:ribosomal protein S18 acetylase RimI-like enzyme
MIEIRPLTELNLDDLHRVASGYVSDERYAVDHSETDELISFTLRREKLSTSYVKKYEFNTDTIKAYRPHLENGFSFAVYDGDLIGLAVSELHQWNNSLWIHEFHIAEPYRRRGLGKQLMERVAEAARDAGIRILVCETQNTNASAIKVYRQLGFSLEGVDLSYYRNSDQPDGEIAVFMKRRLG